MASAIFLPTPPGERNTEPGVVECKECVGSMPGFLSALDVISIAAEPTIIRGEGDPGRCECLGELVVCCGGVAVVLAVGWCFTTAGYFGDRFYL